MESAEYNRKVNKICVLIIINLVLNICFIMGDIMGKTSNNSDIDDLLIAVLSSLCCGAGILCAYGINKGQKFSWYLLLIMTIIGILLYVYEGEYDYNAIICIILLSLLILLLMIKDVRAHCSILGAEFD